MRESGFALFIAGLVLQAVMFPLIEEPIYRGICFVALYNYKLRNRVLAYLGSAIIFILAHSPSYYELFRFARIGLNITEILMLFCFSIITAYIYEKTGKMLLCIWFHSLANGMDYFGAFFGYLTK